MDPFADLRATTAGKLTAAGLAATIDPAALPPLVLVDIPVTTIPAGVGGWGVSLEVRIVATAPLDATGAGWLTATLTTVLRTLGFAPAAKGLYSHAGKDCPAITLTYPLQVNNPDC